MLFHFNLINFLKGRIKLDEEPFDLNIGISCAQIKYIFNKLISDKEFKCCLKEKSSPYYLELLDLLNNSKEENFLKEKPNIEIKFNEENFIKLADVSDFIDSFINEDLTEKEIRKINYDELIIQDFEEANSYLEDKAIKINNNIISFKTTQLDQKKHIFTINKALYESYFHKKRGCFKKEDIIKV